MVPCTADLVVMDLAYDGARMGKYGKQEMTPGYLSSAHLELGEKRKRENQVELFFLPTVKLSKAR